MTPADHEDLVRLCRCRVADARGVLDGAEADLADAIARKGDEERRTAALEQWPLDARFDDSDVTSQVDLSDLAEETR